MEQDVGKNEKRDPRPGTRKRNTDDLGPLDAGKQKRVRKSANAPPSIEKLQAENKRLKLANQKLEKRLQSRSTIPANITDDTTIRTRFKELKRRCASWVKDFSADKVELPIPPQILESWFNILGNPQYFIASPEDITQLVLTHKVGPKVLLTALLWQFMCCEIIMKPFFCLRWVEGHKISKNVEQVLESVTSVIKREGGKFSAYSVLSYRRKYI